MNLETEMERCFDALENILVQIVDISEVGQHNNVGSEFC